MKKKTPMKMQPNMNPMEGMATPGDPLSNFDKKQAAKKLVKKPAKASKVKALKKAEAAAEKSGNKKDELKLEKKISKLTGKPYKGKV